MNLSKLQNIVLHGPNANNLYMPTDPTEEQQEVWEDWQSDIEGWIGDTEEDLYEDFGTSGQFAQDLFGKYGQNWQVFGLNQREIMDQYYDQKRKFRGEGVVMGAGWGGEDLIMKREMDKGLQGLRIENIKASEQIYGDMRDRLEGDMESIAQWIAEFNATTGQAMDYDFNALFPDLEDDIGQNNVYMGGSPATGASEQPSGIQDWEWQTLGDPDCPLGFVTCEDGQCALSEEDCPEYLELEGTPGVPDEELEDSIPGGWDLNSCYVNPANFGCDTIECCDYLGVGYEGGDIDCSQGPIMIGGVCIACCQEDWDEGEGCEPVYISTGQCIACCPDD